MANPASSSIAAIGSVGRGRRRRGISAPAPFGSSCARPCPATSAGCRPEAPIQFLSDNGSIHTALETICRRSDWPRADHDGGLRYADAVIMAFGANHEEAIAKGLKTKKRSSDASLGRTGTTCGLAPRLKKLFAWNG